MLSLANCLVLLAGAVAATVAAAASHQPALHMTATGLAALTLVALAAIEHRRLRANGASASFIGQSTARWLGFVWAWGALAIVATYLGVWDRTWPEWWQFFLGFAVAAIACFAFSGLLARDAAAGSTDDILIRIGRYLVQLQLVAMIVGIISLFVDEKFPRSVVHADWAGCNICFFGALAIAAISLDALRYPHQRAIEPR
jgi:hypothetical protein